MKRLVRKVPFKSKRKGVFGRKKGRKIIASKKNTYDGVDFKSMLERYFYKTIKVLCSDLEYEPESYVIFDKFQFQGSTVRSISYTPDFRSKKKKFIVETKGWANDAFPLRLKMFKKMLIETQSTYTFYLLKNQHDIDEFAEMLKKGEDSG